MCGFVAHMGHRMSKSNRPAERAPARSGDLLNLVNRRIEELKPDPANPRRHSRKQIRQIAQSIAAFGFNAPILVDAELQVIAGHGRLLACRELG
jgi:ParB-like nuclease family protein